MLVTYRNDELNEYLTIWLCCTTEGVAVDHHLYQRCTNTIVVESRTFTRATFSEKGELYGHLNPDQIQKAFRHLTSDQKMVIYLKIIKGLSNNKVAEILSKSVGAVKAIQNRALTALTHLLSLEQEMVVE